MTKARRQKSRLDELFNDILGCGGKTVGGLILITLAAMLLRKAVRSDK